MRNKGSVVSMVKCKTYDEAKVEASVRQSLELIGGLKTVVKPGNKVLLKPNMLSPTPPDKMVTTHPSLIKALVKLVKEAGGVPLVGDSPGGAFMAAERSLKVTGIGPAAQEAGAEIVYFEKESPVEIPNPDGKKFKQIYIARPVLEADVIISIPKLKTHPMAVLTMSIKNLFGVVPGLLKSEYHRRAPFLDEFAEAVVDIFCYLRDQKPLLTVMDAIVGMDGPGPQRGNPFEIGLVLASKDLASLDAVCSSIVGIDPLEVGTTKVVTDRKAGVTDLNEITIVGEKLEEVKVKGFSPPPFTTRQPTKAWVLRMVNEICWTRPVVNPNKCVMCQVCVKSCPVQAMTLKGKDRIVIDYDKCIVCFCCHEMCIEGAVGTKESLANMFVKTATKIATRVLRW